MSISCETRCDLLWIRRHSIAARQKDEKPSRNLIVPMVSKREGFRAVFHFGATVREVDVACSGNS